MSNSMMIKVKITRKQVSKLFARVIKLEKLLGREQKRICDYQETVLFLTGELMLSAPKNGKERLIEFCKANVTTAATIEQFLADAGFYYGSEPEAVPEVKPEGVPKVRPIAKPRPVAKAEVEPENVPEVGWYSAELKP